MRHVRSRIPSMVLLSEYVARLCTIHCDYLWDNIVGTNIYPVAHNARMEIVKDI